MKKNVLLVLFLVGALQACTNQAEQAKSNQLTENLKRQISNEIMEVSNQWIEDNKALNADKAINFWSTSPELRFAENGEFFVNRDSIHSTLKNFYLNTRSMNVEWLNRDIKPLSVSTAMISGEFQFKLEFKDGSNWHGTNAFTGVFIKENEKWSLIQGHESVKQE